MCWLCWHKHIWQFFGEIYWIWDSHLIHLTYRIMNIIFPDKMGFVSNDMWWKSNLKTLIELNLSIESHLNWQYSLNPNLLYPLNLSTPFSFHSLLYSTDVFWMLPLGHSLYCLPSIVSSRLLEIWYIPRLSSPTPF